MYDDKYNSTDDLHPSSFKKVGMPTVVSSNVVLRVYIPGVEATRAPSLRKSVQAMQHTYKHYYDSTRRSYNMK